ncbi:MULTISPECIES: hypothetical protein [Pseudomonas]|jgi:nitrous oxide reductase accessory protein NosL|uniref:Lipoprotein n=1 Tax=Pseudomonas asiatica TaxID=2219225 RepID=A0A9X4DHR8_9PSED|nr:MULTISPECIES: hypothetical protein [Pseudomonas]MCG3646653.1 hypothetical protein [Pseudomonas putida]MDD2116021.1 hypothetical protein [Pseudomonas asiatica]TFW18221.1 hypothetical protein E4L40_25995 [Pseudomonas putida]
MKNTITALLAVSILAGCDAAAEKAPAQQAAKADEAHNCTTTGPNAPIVTGENSVVVINGKTYAPGQSSGCAPAYTNVSTHGVGSPIVTGEGAKVVIHTDHE